MLDRVVTARDPEEVGHSTTLGHLRLRNEHTNEIILIPTPSTDPNDPLNWYVSSVPAHLCRPVRTNQVETLTCPPQE